MRSESTVEQERRTALEEFGRSRSAPLELGTGHGAAREARAELERQQAVRRRELDAAEARRAAHAGLEPAERPRAVVVHRVAWTREALRRGLEQSGVDVVDVHEDGAAGLGCIVAEQPDLVVLQQQLPWRDGLDVAREVRRFAPAARVAVHLDQPQAEQRAREAGAHACFPRSTRPDDMLGVLRELAADSGDPAVDQQAG